MSIKISRVKKLSKWGIYQKTFSECIDAIPKKVLEALTSKQIALLIDANQTIYQNGKLSNEQEISEYLGCDFWKVDWDKTKLVKMES